MEDHAELQSVLGFRVALCLFVVISPFLFFLLLLIHVALNPVSSHAYKPPLNVVHTLIINSLLMIQVVFFSTPRVSLSLSLKAFTPPIFDLVLVAIQIFGIVLSFWLRRNVNDNGI